MLITNKSYAYALTTVLFWSTVATAFKLSLEHLDVLQLVLYASVMAALVLLAPVIIAGNLSLLVREFRNNMVWSIGIALLNPLLYYVVLFEAYDRLPAQIAQPVNYTWALVLVFMSMIFLGQKPTRYDLTAAFISYSGVVIIATGSPAGAEPVTTLGLLLAILSTLIWAGYWILDLRDPRDDRVSMAINFTLAIPLALIACFIFSDIEAPLAGLFGASYVGVFEMGLAFLFWSRALKLAENTSRVSTLIFLSPFISLGLIHWLVGEEIVLTTYVGLFVIITGLAVQRWPLLKRNDLVRR